MPIQLLPAVAIALAVVVNLAFALFPVRVSVFGGIRLDIWITGPFSIALLWIVGVLPTATLVAGFVGSHGLVPWRIIVVFFSTAYVSVSADNTGLFDYAAYRIVRRAGSSGPRLFTSIYLFSLVLTLFTSNDIVILTLTPIIFYLGRHAKLDVVPLLFAEFVAANTSSMLLYIGNPTNIIIGDALDIGFWHFSLVMLLPALVASVSYLGVLFLVFRRPISQPIELSAASSYYVRSRAEALCSLGLLIAMLAALAFSELAHAPIWLLTALAAVGTMIKDLAFDLFARSRRERPERQSPRNVTSPHPVFRDSRVGYSLAKMPWAILPFVLVFFSLVQGLTDAGVTSALATIASKVLRGPLVSSLAFGVAGVVAANLMNNQPMSILFAHILVNPAFVVSRAAFSAAAYAVVIASNLGANLTLVGALAGLMWRRILSQKGVAVSFGRFLAVGLKTTPIVLGATLLALAVVISVGVL